MEAKIIRTPTSGITGIALLANEIRLPQRHGRDHGALFGLAGRGDRVRRLGRGGDKNHVDLVVDDQILATCAARLGVGYVSPQSGLLASILGVMSGSEALTVLPYSVVFMQRRSDTIAALPVKLEHPDRQLGLLWRNGRAQ